MKPAVSTADGGGKPLAEVARLRPDKVLNPGCACWQGGIPDQAPVLVILAAGKGTRFGQDPKCIQPVLGVPLALHSIRAFRRFSPSPVIATIGYRHAEVGAALGAEALCVVSRSTPASSSASRTTCSTMARWIPRAARG